VISDDDIKLCASALVTMFGKDAPVRVAERAEEYLTKGEKEGYAFWKKVEKAIEELLNSEPGLGWSTHQD
jgi:hypothetical protein